VRQSPGTAGKGAMVGGAYAGGRIGTVMNGLKSAPRDFMAGYHTSPTGKGFGAGAGRAAGNAGNWFRNKLGGK